MTFSEKLQKARQKKSLTQVQLAEKVGVTARSIQNYELGARFPRREILSRICKALNIRVETLLSNDDFIDYETDEKDIKEIKSAKKVLKAATAFFVNRDISQRDKDILMRLLQETYWEAKTDI